MKYLNPFHTLEITPELLEVDASGELKMLRQRLLAEFELHETATLTLQGKELDKAGVLFLIAELENEAHREYHAHIFRNPQIRSFLEDGVANFTGLDFQQIFHSKDFNEFIAPHFARQYNTQLYFAVKHQKLVLIDQLNSIHLPFSPKWIAQCYQDTYRFLVYQLKEAKSMDRKIAVVHNYGPILAGLPSYFDTVQKMYEPYRQASEFRNLTEDIDTAKIKRYVLIGLGIAAAIAFFSLL